MLMLFRTNDVFWPFAVKRGDVHDLRDVRKQNVSAREAATTSLSITKACSSVLRTDEFRERLATLPIENIHREAKKMKENQYCDVCSGVVLFNKC